MKFKNLKLNNGMIRRLKSGIGAVVIAFSFTGCAKTHEPVEETYNLIETTSNEGIYDDAEIYLENGLTQVLDVRGEDFKLVTKYDCKGYEDGEWKITSDKSLDIDVYTEGLPEGTLVYINSIRVETILKSRSSYIDGIRQYKWTDNVNNLKLFGFYISDNEHYYGTNKIEGYDNDFASLVQSVYFDVTHNHLAEKSRFSERDFLKIFKVYANKISITYDLLIKGPNDLEFTNSTVTTEFLVPIVNSKFNDFTKTQSVGENNKGMRRQLVKNS